MREREEWKVLDEDEMWGRLRGGMSRKPIDWAEISDILWWARGRDEEAGGDAMERFLDYLRHHLRDHAEKGGGWYAGERKIWTLGGAEFPMRWIPAGTFLMGAGADDKEALEEERPQREVTLTRGFWIGETPVTQRQDEAVMGENPSSFKKAGLDAPVERVSWYDAAVFANQLSVSEGCSPCFVGEGEEMTGMGDRLSGYVECEGWRLPTEAEWEYAARAGTRTPRYGELENIAWYDENSHHTTHPVGLKGANTWGLHDTLGNVWEWCDDGFVDDSAKAALEPVPVAEVQYRILRGGSWNNLALDVRAAYRNYIAPSTNDFSSIGFRVVRSVG
jgi:formylglycine-generating enzyme required for sulfatase activity